MRRPGRTGDAFTYVSVNEVRRYLLTYSQRRRAVRASTATLSTSLSKNSTIVLIRILLSYEAEVPILHSHLSNMNFHYELPFSSLISSIANKCHLSRNHRWNFSEFECFADTPEEPFMCMRMLIMLIMLIVRTLMNIFVTLCNFFDILMIIAWCYQLATK